MNFPNSLDEVTLIAKTDKVQLKNYVEDPNGKLVIHLSLDLSINPLPVNVSIVVHLSIHCPANSSIYLVINSFIYLVILIHPFI